MAKQLDFTDAIGNNHSNSYWKVTIFNVNFPEKSLFIEFTGYNNKIPIGHKSYTLHAQEFDKFSVNFSKFNVIQLAYMYAKDTKDQDTEIPWIKVSFFEEAKDV